MCYISETGTERGLFEGSFTYSDSDLKQGFLLQSCQSGPTEILTSNLLFTDGKDDAEQTNVHKLCY